MTINIDEWLNLAIEKLKKTFSENLIFVGLQGSYNRGEATSNSDIDLVVILDEMSFEDLKEYRKIINEMPDKELACGFISGKDELQNWSKADLFQFFYDTKPLAGNLEDIIQPPAIEDIKKSFKKFILMLPENGMLVINQDDTHCMEVLDDVKDELQRRNVRIFKFSLSDPDAYIYAKNFSCNMKGFYSFDVTDPRDGKTYNFYLTVPGIHNVYDALAAITTSLAYGIDFKHMQKSLSKFCGASRRFEYKKTIAKDVELFDDYAHHPTEIKATLAAAKQKEHNRVIAVFQPHTYSRTKELLQDFAHAFVDADIVYLMDIYAAREIDDGTISSKDVADLVNKNGTKAYYIPTLEKISEEVKKVIEPGDIVLSIGAGTVTHLADYFEDVKKEKKSDNK